MELSNRGGWWIHTKKFFSPLCDVPRMIERHNFELINLVSEFLEKWPSETKEERSLKMVSNFYCLRAQNPSKTLDRRYSLYLTRDLFGEWILITQGERESRKGKRKRYIFTDEEEAKKKLQQTLKSF